MNKAGFGKLKSEWWHFQDIYDENKNKLTLGGKEAPIFTFEIQKQKTTLKFFFVSFFYCTIMVGE
ncbi:MAG: hypothetical protein IJS56_02340 [Bacilli bacterium]|nr:hypothetical protein [Bacilli bacterium]